MGEKNAPEPERLVGDTPAVINTTPVDFPASGPVPDVYADGVTVRAGYAGFTLTFSRSLGEETEPMAVAVVRLSPQQTLVMTQVLKKILRNFQQDIGPLHLPETLYEALDIEREL